MDSSPSDQPEGAEEIKSARASFVLPGSHSESRDDTSEFDVASSLAVNYSERDFSERDPTG